MIREVEIQNTLQEQAGVLTAEDFIKIKLQDEGKTMVIDIEKKLEMDFHRRVVLDYMIIDYNNNSFVKENISTTVTSVSGDSTTHIIDLSEVLSTPVDIPVELSQNFVNVDLFTYEANIETAYGKKRLSVPYKVTSDIQPGFPSSTDGWYQLSVTDIPKNQYEIDHFPGDIVWSDYEEEGTHPANAFYVAVNRTHGIPSFPDDYDNWRPATEEDFENFNLSIQKDTEQYGILRVVDDLIVSRNVKQKFIYELIKATNFSDHDDVVAKSVLARITAMREAVISYLEMGDPIRAKYTLDRIAVEYNDYKEGITVGNNNLNISKFTL